MSEGDKATAKPAAPPLRILLIEDDEFDVAVFGRAFRRGEIPCEIVRCRSGEEALDGLRDAEIELDLLVTDHQLPGQSGFELCMQLVEKYRSEGTEPPFALVLLTGVGSEQMAIRALRAGISDYIVKDASREYLDLLPLVLPRVARRHRQRRRRTLGARHRTAGGQALRLPPSGGQASRLPPSGGQALGSPPSGGKALRSPPPGGQALRSPPSGGTLAESAWAGGLGLSACADVVKQRGGRVWVEDGNGQGPALHFSVPLAPDEAAFWTAAGAEPDPAPPIAAVVEGAGREPSGAVAGPVGEQARHVLIVHPNPIVTFVARRTAERSGCRVAEVAGGRKAIEALDREPFDLVLMAPEMPDLDGLETTRRIRSREGAAEGRIAILALGAGDGVAERCREAGMDGIVATPVSIQGLKAAIEGLPTGLGSTG